MQERFEISINNEKLVGVIHKGIRKSNTCVVCCHGLLANKDGLKYLAIGEELSEHDINVVRFDFRGCGESDGRLGHSNITNRLSDLDEVIAFLKSSYNYKQFGLFGSSMGAFISYLKASSDDHDLINAMVSLASPYSMTELFEKRKVDESHFEVDGIIFGEEFVIDLKYHGSLNPEILGKISCPVYMFHGDLDGLVPASHAKNIYQYLKTDKQLQIISGGNHIFSNPDHINEIVQVSLEWYTKYLNDDQTSLTENEKDEKRLERIKELEIELEQLRAQIPAHSVKPEMIMHLEELEDELERLKRK